MENIIDTLPNTTDVADSIKNHMAMNSVTMMVIMPLLTTISSKIVDFIVGILKTLLNIILFVFMKLTYKYIKKNDCIIEIEIFNTGANNMIRPTNIGRTLLWYFKKNNIMISKKYMFSMNTTSLNDDSSIKDFGGLLPIPLKFEQKFIDVVSKDNEKNKETVKISDVIVNDESTSFEYLENDICCNMTKRNSTLNFSTNTATYLILKSKNIQHIESYIMNIAKEYQKYLDSINNIFHGRILFLKAPLLNQTNDTEMSYSEYNYDKTQIFDNLFFEGKNKIMAELDNLNNPEYFHKRGLKRKIALLIYGAPGSGKTCLVNAIANYSKRLIICAPISRINTNASIEKILYSDHYNSDDKIILFDEIDSFNNKNMTKYSKLNNPTHIEKKTFADSSTDDNKNNEQINDPFDIGIFLSLLDGIHDQDDMIIIATANNISNIDPALFRNGRLKLIDLTYVGREEIKQMIELYCEVEITEEQLLKIRNDRIIQNLTIKNVCINSINNMDDFDVNSVINEINDLKEIL